jgi:ATP-dependent RNA helicase DHX29
LAPPTPTSARKVSRLDANAPTFIPSPKLFPNPFNNHIADTDQSTLKSRVLAAYDGSTSYSSSERDSPETDDPNVEYVRLKMQITNLTSHRPSGNNTDAAVLKELSTQLDAIKKHYFFDEKDAEVQYQIEREKEDALALQSRLRGIENGNLASHVAPTPKAGKKRPPVLQSLSASPAPAVVSDLFDGDSDSSTGVLEILDELPESVTNNGVTVHMRDMALPKHWSGRTPKILLSETVAKADRYAAITYQIISGSSRAKRAAVHIRWEGSKIGEWKMEDVACHDETQAEAYIATVALHALTFPLTDGFQAGSSNALGNQTFFRLLPAVFRDLWDELEAARKDRDDSINRSVWARLRTIIEPKLDSSQKVRFS